MDKFVGAAPGGAKAQKKAITDGKAMRWHGIEARRSKGVSKPHKGSR